MVKFRFKVCVTAQSIPECAVTIEEFPFELRSTAILHLKSILSVSIGTLIRKIELLELSENDKDWLPLCSYDIISLPYDKVFFDN